MSSTAQLRAQAISLHAESGDSARCVTAGSGVTWVGQHFTCDACNHVYGEGYWEGVCIPALGQSYTICFNCYDAFDAEVSYLARHRNECRKVAPLLVGAFNDPSSTLYAYPRDVLTCLSRALAASG